MLSSASASLTTALLDQLRYQARRRLAALKRGPGVARRRASQAARWRDDHLPGQLTRRKPDPLPQVDHRGGRLATVAVRALAGRRRDRRHGADEHPHSGLDRLAERVLVGPTEQTKIERGGSRAGLLYATEWYFRRAA